MSKSKPGASIADPAIDETQTEPKPASKRKVRVLAKATRDGVTTQVLTDDVRVWKETSE